MPNSTIIFKNASIVNDLQVFSGDILVRNGIIEKIEKNIHVLEKIDEIDCEGLYIIPGIIDDQVHFREPGLTNKATIRTESAAAIAGGITSFMEMPNTLPPATTIELLEQKYQLASQTSYANYSFYLGATNDNLAEIKSADYSNICGVKIFMGSSTGDLLVDEEQALENIFQQCPALVTTHCEDESTIKANLDKFLSRYGNMITPQMHAQIRSAEGCYLSSFKAVNLAKKFNARLHVLHISTGKEVHLFEIKDRKEKRITAEACVHHLYFSDQDYAKLGNKIKCNPAIKTVSDKDQILQGLITGNIDIIATDHAPHTLEEKEKSYLNAPSGLPLVQHSLLMMLSHRAAGKISLEWIVDKMCHAPADIFKVKHRGYIKEGFAADLVLLDLNQETEIKNSELFYKCAWSPLEGTRFPGKIVGTWVNGNNVYANGKLSPFIAGQRLQFMHEALN